MTRFALLLALAFLASPAAAQSGCDGYRGVAPLFHRYIAMLEPKSAAHARAAATRVKLDVLNGDAVTWLLRQGMRSDAKGFDDLAASVEDEVQLAELWLSGSAVTASALRGHAAARERMGLRLVDSGCFSDGTIIQVGQNDAPESAGKRIKEAEEMTLAQAAASVARQWQAFLDDPPPWWLLTLYVFLPLVAGGALWTHLYLRRVHERRGYPRRIFTGRLTVAVGPEEITVAAADIGRGGAKIHLHRRLDGARRVELRTAGLSIPALLSWQNAHFQGLSFLHPITRSELRAICATAPRK